MKRVPPMPDNADDNNKNQFHIIITFHIELTSDWLRARRAAFREELTEAIGTVRLLIATSETLSGQLNRAVSAGEAFTMVWLVLVGNATAGDYLEKV